MSKKSTVTYQERLAAGLTAMGFTEIKSKSSKFRCFVKEGMRRYWIGKAGALRAGDSVSRSWSMGCPGDETSTFRKVLAEGDQALAPAIAPATREKLAASGIGATDVAILETLAESDPLLARALENV